MPDLNSAFSPLCRMLRSMGQKSQFKPRCQHALLTMLLFTVSTLPLRPALAEDAAWNFTLPSLDGQRFVSLAALAGPVLVNFWGVDCPPCVAELPMLGAYARQHADWQVLLVNTDSAAAAQRFLESHALSDMALSDINALTLLRPGLNVSGLMRKAGNLHGVLPYSVAVNSRKHICFRKAGALTQDDLVKMREVCR